MEEAKSRNEWDHTANVMRVIANSMRTKGSGYKISDFHPFHEVADATPGDLAELRRTLESWPKRER